MVYTSAPSVICYLQDKSGRRTGPAFNRPFAEGGSQPCTVTLHQIPHSWTEQEKMTDWESGRHYNLKATCWIIGVKGGGKQTYSLRLTGLSFGRARVLFEAMVGNKPIHLSSVIETLMTPAETIDYNVDYDPGQKTLSVHCAFPFNRLGYEIEAARQLKMITSPEVSERLKKAAHNPQDFLYALGESRPEGCPVPDDHAAVKEPALSILKAEAKLLLAYGRPIPWGGDLYQMGKDGQTIK